MLNGHNLQSTECNSIRIFRESSEAAVIAVYKIRIDQYKIFLSHLQSGWKNVRLLNIDVMNTGGHT